MKRIHYSLIAILIVQMATSLGGVALAQQDRSIPTSARARTQTGQILTRIQTRRNAFRQSFELAVNRSRREDGEQVRAAQEHFNALDAALQSFRQRYSQRRETASDVTDLMTHARSLDRFFSGRFFLDTRSRQDWTTLSSELNLLAEQYGVREGVTGDNGRNNDRGNWGRRPPVRTDPNAVRLTGTYRIDPTRTEDPMRVAERVSRGLSAQQQERVRNMIRRRLEAPEIIAIEREARRITLVSTNAPAVTFEADGRTRVEQTPRGRSVRVAATLLGDQLIVSQIGERGNDFRVTFDPAADGRSMTVTRQMDIESISRPVVVTSTYDKTSEVAQTDIFTGRPAGGGRPGTPNGTYTVVDGTQLVATLNENLMTQQTKAGDRFTLTVQSPREYEGAIIEGYVVDADRSGRLAGRSEIALNFERIRLRNGSSHSFEGIIESVRTPRGDTIRVDNEGTVSERSGQTQRTVTRTGIGAAIGAVIGAITGGGSGAAIGAAVGAGAGAGSIIIEGRDDLELLTGTQFTIRASAPREAASIR